MVIRRTKTSTHALAAALLAAAALMLATAGRAHASTTMPTMLQDDTTLVYGSPAARDSRLDELQSLGVDIVKVRVSWRALAPSHKPAGFDGTNPVDYSQTAWARYDAVVQGAQARGMQVFFQLGGDAPLWATGGKHKSQVYQPNAAEFRKFVQAVGTRYPSVRLFSVWNEPNLVSWLAPQYKSGVPYAPVIYRALLYAARDGLNASGHSGQELLLGELLPFTRTSTDTSIKTRPIAFLRELACVDSHYRPYKGKAARLRSCEHFTPLPGTGLAYHPYTLAGGPDVPTPNRDDASIGNLGRVTSALDKLSARHRLGLSGRMPLWITEFGFQSDPPDPVTTPIKKIPGFMGESEWIAFRNPRVMSYSQYPMIDDPGRGAGFQSGLRFHNGKPKPGVYAAFRTPFWVRLITGSRVEAFGGARSASSGTVTIQSRSGSKGSWTNVATVPVDSSGYFDRTLTASGAKKRQFRFVYGSLTSRVTGATKR
jgi:hypothetical protein